MRVLGIIVLVILSISSTAAARVKLHTKKRKAGPTLRQRSLCQRSTFSSPDQRHVAQLTRAGQVSLNGNRVLSGEGRTIGRPTWRHDSGALAYLQSSSHGRQLVVLPRLDTRHPLIWNLPVMADGLNKVIWISEHRVGVGSQELVPRLVVSWTTSTQSDN